MEYNNKLHKKVIDVKLVICELVLFSLSQIYKLIKSWNYDSHKLESNPENSTCRGNLRIAELVCFKTSNAQKNLMSWMLT